MYLTILKDRSICVWHDLPPFKARYDSWASARVERGQARIVKDMLGMRQGHVIPLEAFLALAFEVP